jgi:hypothetical protein
MLSLIHCLLARPGFFSIRGERFDHGEYVDVGVAFVHKTLSICLRGLIFAGDEKHAAIDSPLSLPRMGKGCWVENGD